MADSQTERSGESRFSKALLGRVAAVGLFLALGTAAVVFMIDGKRTQSLNADGADAANPASSETGTESEVNADPAANLMAQVKASFSEEPSSINTSTPAVLKPNLAAPNRDPDAGGNPDQKSAASFSDKLPPLNPAVTPPADRYASLNQFGGTQPQLNESQESDKSSAVPAKPFEPSNSDMFANPSNTANPPDRLATNKPQDLGGFNPNPNPSLNPNPNLDLIPKPNSTTDKPPTTDFNATPGAMPQRGVPGQSSEPLKPFAVPNLTNRLTETPDLNSPNLKAPVPNRDQEPQPFPAEPPKVADNNPFDNIGKPPANGILKPFAPPNNSPTDETKETNEKMDSFNTNPSNPNLNRPLNSDQFSAPSPTNSLASPQRDFGAPPTTGFADSNQGPANPAPLNQPLANQQLANQPDTTISPTPNLPSGTLPGRTLARPVSAPISSGSAINQPLSDPLKQRNPSGAIEMPEPRTANLPGERRLEGLQAPALTVEKLSPKEVTLNEVAEFMIVIRNVGRVAANDVTVHDEVPANTQFQDSNPPPQQVSGDRKLIWQIGTLGPGQEKRIQYQLKPTTPGEIGSVAHVTFSTQASMRTMVTNPILEIVHRSKPVAMVGSDVVLDVTVSNKGNGPAKDVLIQEDVPTQLQYQEGYRELEYEVGTLLPGQSKRIQLPLKAVAVGRLRNTISAIAAGGQRAQHEIDLEVVAPKLTAQSDGPTKRFLGRQVMHQFKVTNQGTASATNVDLVAKLPSGLRFMQANNQGVYRRETHSVYWSMADLAANADAAVELLTMPVEVGNQDIKFDAAADLNQTAGAIQSLSIEHLVDIFFDIDDLVDPIEVGADTAYQIKIANQGTQAANNVQMQVDFPNGIVPTSVEGNLQHQIAGQKVQFAPINNLKPGEQLIVVIRAKGQAAGDHRVVATMQADGRQSAVAKEEITKVYADR